MGIVPDIELFEAFVDKTLFTSLRKEVRSKGLSATSRERSGTRGNARAFCVIASPPEETENQRKRTKPPPL